MTVIVVCSDGMRFGRYLEPQLGVVGCVVGFDYVIARETGQTDGETQFPIYQECFRVVVSELPA